MKIVCQTNKPVATDSPDHIAPHGAKQDNSRNPLFNKKLYKLLNAARVSVLDLGCSGGAFVKDCLDDGHLAIGLEGSDYCQRSARGAWPAIPEHLFTCDVTQEFSLVPAHGKSSADSLLRFDAVTSWELMEHVAEPQLEAVCSNVRRHLKPGGIWIMSVADFEDVVRDVVYHQTVHGKEWWLELFAAHGFQHHQKLADYFDIDWVRGPLQLSESFHLVLTRAGDRAPRVPKLPAYSVDDVLEVVAMAVEQAADASQSNNLTLEYALTLLESAVRSGQPHDQLNYWRAWVLLHLGRIEDCVAALDMQADQTPDDDRLARLREHVKQLLEDGTIEGMDEFLVSFNRGKRLLQAGHLDAAQVDLKRALERRRDSTEVRQWWQNCVKALAQRAVAAQQWQRAADLLGDCGEHLVEDGEWHFLHARALAARGEKIKARQLFDLAMRFGYDSGSVFLHRGILMRELGHLQQSECDLEEAVRLRADDEDAYQHLQATVRARGAATPSLRAVHRSGRAAKPKISIVTPTFNCAALLSQCIESVMAQGYENFEHIVVDGASTDGTAEVLRRYPHVNWVSEPDDGEAQALNKALSMVSGDIIGWLNADDRYIKGAFDAISNAAADNPDAHLFYGKALFIDDSEVPTNWVIPYAPLNVVTLTRWFRLNLFQPSIFFSTELMRDVGPFREDLNYGVDYDYWFRIAAKGYAFHYLDRVFAKAMIYREGGKTETPYAVKAQEWLQICSPHLEALSDGEQIHFWKDYYEFRFRNFGSPAYYADAAVEVGVDPRAMTGFMLAAKELGLVRGGIIDPVLGNDMPDCANVMGVLGEHLRMDARQLESAKAFEWALGLESNDAWANERFGNASRKIIGR